ncbi:hypothetical protein D3C76_1350500 [compost metagenome]
MTERLPRARPQVLSRLLQLPPHAGKAGGDDNVDVGQAKRNVGDDDRHFAERHVQLIKQHQQRQAHDDIRDNDRQIQ